MYTKQQFGEDLLNVLAQGYDVRRIAKWCYCKYLDERHREAGLGKIMDVVFGMGAGPEFELSEAELRDLVARCLEQ